MSVTRDPGTSNDAPPTTDQVRFWEQWNSDARESRISPSSERQWQEIQSVLQAMQGESLSIIDVGCGTGWLSSRLSSFGSVTGVDFVPAVLQRAQDRYPNVRFVCGDIFQLSLPRAGFDLVVSLEVLSHVSDQPAFVARLASLLRPGGTLIVCTQNRPVLERWDAVSPRDPSQIRNWVNAKELRKLLSQSFHSVNIGSLFPVGNRGLLRILNSPKVNAAVGLLVGHRQILRWKERWMLGHTLFAVARSPV